MLEVINNLYYTGGYFLIPISLYLIVVSLAAVLILISIRKVIDNDIINKIIDVTRKDGPINGYSFSTKQSRNLLANKISEILLFYINGSNKDEVISLNQTILLLLDLRSRKYDTISKILIFVGSILPMLIAFIGYLFAQLKILQVILSLGGDVDKG